MKHLLWISGLWLALLAVTAGQALCGDVSVTAMVEPSVVPVGEQARLTITVQGKFRKSAKPELPQLDAFDIYDSGSSQNFSFINGQISSSLSFTYLIVPRKEGMYKLTPIRFRVGDKMYEAEPVTVEVVKASTQVTPPSRAQTRTQAPSRTGKEESTGQVFIEASVDRDTIYVNQQLTWTLFFYSDRRIQFFQSPTFMPPSAEGFWVDDVPPQRKYYETVDGTSYLVNEVKRAYFPTAPGEYTIGAAQVEVTLDQVNRRSINNLFNRSFGFGKPVLLSTKAKKIVVLPLPQRGKPSAFSGIVGSNLELTLRVDRQVVQVGEPVNVSIEISGEGNAQTITAPPLAKLTEFKVYESGSSSDTYKKDYTVSGRKKYDYVLVPKSEGKKVIPPVTLSYFDPVKGAYKSISSSPLRLDVKPGTQEEGRKVVFAGGGSDIEVIGQDIRFIHPVPAALSLSRTLPVTSAAYAAIHVLPALAVIFSLAVERRRKRRRENEPMYRAAEAARVAGRRLDATAKRASTKKGRVEDVYTETASALRAYFGDRMNTSPAGLTSEAIDTYLRDEGVENAAIQDVLAILNLCDAARYSSTETDGRGAADVPGRAADMIKTLEKSYQK